MYADDKRIHITMTPGGRCPLQALGKCTEDINDWTCHNLLLIKTEGFFFEEWAEVDTELQSIHQTSLVVLLNQPTIVLKMF